MTEHDFKGLCLETDLLLEQAAGNELSLPEPDSSWEERLKELRDAKFSSHLSKAIHEMRTWQAEQLGFKQISIADVTEGITGEPHTSTEDESDRKNYDYIYYHTEDKAEVGDDCKWGANNPTRYYKEIPTGIWFLPPYGKAKRKWEVESIYNLDDVRSSIPLRVVAGINGLKRLKLFNAFKAYQTVNNHSNYTVIVGIQWNIWNNKGEDGKMFFVARY